jgi:hypothetical protein
VRKTIGEILRAHREGRGETREAMARRVAVRPEMEPIELEAIASWEDVWQIFSVAMLIALAEQYEPGDPAARSRLLCELVAAQPHTWLDPAEWPVPEGVAVLVCDVSGGMFVAMRAGVWWEAIDGRSHQLIGPADRWTPLPGRPEVNE